MPIGDATLRLGIGDITVTVEGRAKAPRFIWMAHRAAEFGERRSDRARIARALSIRPDDIRSDLPIQAVSTGNPFLFIPLRSFDALARCVSSESALREMFRGAQRMLPVHMFVCGQSLGSGVRARMFAPHTDGIVEDPATGSAAAPLGSYLAAHGAADAALRVRFEVTQGVEMERRSEITVELVRSPHGEPSIRIGGQCAIVAKGEMRI